MRIYPTNNSISYKILEKLNGYFFDAGVPKNVCGYFWLSVFYGVASVFVLYNVVMAIWMPLDMVFETNLFMLVGSLHPLFSIFGLIAGFILICALYLTFYSLLYIALPITLVLLIGHFVFKGKVRYVSLSQYLLYLSLLTTQSIAKTQVYKFFKAFTTKVWNFKRFIKCKKLDFEEK